MSLRQIFVESRRIREHEDKRSILDADVTVLIQTALYVIDHEAA